MSKLQYESNHYDALYAEPDYPADTAACALLQDHYIKAVKTCMKKYAHPDILSIGCGTGYYELRLAPLAGSVTCIELSEKAVSMARMRASALGIRNIQFIKGDGRTFQRLLPGMKFDLIMAIGFLHHLSDSDIDRLIANVRQVLKQHGRFITMDPNRYRAVGLLKRFVSPLIQRYHSAEERELSPRNIQRLFIRYQYSSAATYYIDYFLNPLIWVFPKCPPGLIKLLMPFDRLLTKIPVIRYFGNLFVCIAGR